LTVIKALRGRARLQGGFSNQKHYQEIYWGRAGGRREIVRPLYKSGKSIVDGTKFGLHCGGRGVEEQSLEG